MGWTASLIIAIEGSGTRERIGGLPAWARLVLEATRLGVAEIALWLAPGTETPDLTLVRRPRQAATALRVAVGPAGGEALAAVASRQAAVVWVSATVLLLAGTLRVLLEAAPAEGEAVVVEAGGRPVAAALPAGAVTGAAGRTRLLEAACAADGAGFAVRLLEGLRRRRPCEAGSVLLLTTPAQRRAAERTLLRSLIKAEDVFVNRHLERPISLAITRQLAGSPVTPNQVTAAAIGLGLAAATCLAAGDRSWQVAGALLLVASSIVDCVDGELARLTFRSSRLGGWLDFLGDNLVHIAVFGAITLAAWQGGAGWHVAWLGAISIAAVLATVVLIGLAMYCQGRASFATAAPDHGRVPGGPRLARLANALAGRDFTYIILVLALFGRLEWFLWLSAVGGTLYAAVLAYLYWGAPPPAVSLSQEDR